MPEVRLIDANAAADKIMHDVEVHADEIGIGAVAIMIAFARALRDETDFPTIESEVRHGRWIECDYKELRHGEIWTEHRAGLCCSECRTGFKKSKMTFKQYCAACGAKMQSRMDGGLTMAELKPCPFCGGEVQIINTGLSKNYQFLIRHPAWQKNGCIFDDGKVFYADSAELAAEAWNRRADNG